MDEDLKSIIDAYNKLVRNIDDSASNSTDGRAYGGIIRAGKGKLVESIAKVLVSVAWAELGGAERRIGTEGKRVKIPFNRRKLERISNPVLKDHIVEHIGDYFYTYKPDVMVSVDDRPVLEIECKTYTENAMFKRILVDSSLLKSLFPDMKFVLLQLESQLGGDYSRLGSYYAGSRPTTTLWSYFDVDISIITLLEGERHVDKPIHKEEYFKPLYLESLRRAVCIMKEILGVYV